MVATVDGITALSVPWSVLPVVSWAPVILGLTPASFLPTSSATLATSLVLRLVSAVGLGMCPSTWGSFSQIDYMVAPHLPHICWSSYLKWQTPSHPVQPVYSFLLIPATWYVLCLTCLSLSLPEDELCQHTVIIWFLFLGLEQWWHLADVHAH